MSFSETRCFQQSKIKRIDYEMKVISFLLCCIQLLPCKSGVYVCGKCGCLLRHGISSTIAEVFSAASVGWTQVRAAGLRRRQVIPSHPFSRPQQEIIATKSHFLSFKGNQFMQRFMASQGQVNGGTLRLERGSVARDSVRMQWVHTRLGRPRLLTWLLVTVLQEKKKKTQTAKLNT